MKIRPFDPHTDMERVLALYRACFAEPPWYERFDAIELEREFREILTWPDALFLVAENEDNGIIGGALGFHVCRKSEVYALVARGDRNSFYVAELFVDPTRRTRGVCTSLNRDLLEIARTAGYRRVSVRTSVDQPAIRHLFVDKLGFTVVAQQEVVSTKWIDGVEREVPDTRVLMTGDVPHPKVALPGGYNVGGCWKH